MTLHRRTFLAAASATAFGVSSRASAATPLQASATRLVDTTRLRIDWTGTAEPVSITVSGDPNGATGRLLKAARGGTCDVESPVSPRPYFLLKAQEGTETRVAERLLPLQGGRNFRDLGGYRAQDGRQVRWGRIYRSGVMSGLTAGDFDYLGKLGVAMICDLRSPQERVSEPSPFIASHVAQVDAFDYDMSASMAGFSGVTTREQAISAFAASYVSFLDMLTPNFTDMFAHLVEGQAPLAMNCTAGKDRTGMGSALVLSVLGVPRQTVIADYALTQVYTPPSMYMSQMAKTGTVAGLTPAQAQAMRRMPREVLEVVMGSDPGIMRQALAMIDGKFGGPVELAKTRFGLTDTKVALLRKNYLV